MLLSTINEFLFPFHLVMVVAVAQSGSDEPTEIYITTFKRYLAQIKGRTT
ncbi:MAG: hypothetical protein ACYDHY_06735 [Acidiferrobacterales bacterium]